MVTTISPLVFTELDAILQQMLEAQENILLARNYFNGVQEVYLTARAQEFLGLHDDANTFKLNICRTIVTALANELNLIGFDTNEKADATTGQKEQVVWAKTVYEQNKLSSLQDTVHESAIADSETFIIVEWDKDLGYARTIHNQRFVDVDAGGDGMGVFMIYENDDPNQKPIAAVKQWIETVFDARGVPTSTSRRTIYYPDRIERWIFQNGDWQHFIQQDEAWPLPQKGKDGKPLGIPVFHFKNKGLRAEHWDAIPMQDAINKTLVDILAAEDLTAFKSLFGFGFYPTTDGKEPKADGSNVMKMGPAQFNGTMKGPSDASLQEIEGADMTPLVNTLTQLILLAAQITDTPVSRFITTAAIASADTIKAQESQLKKKGTDRRGLLSDPWAGVMSMARRITNLNTNAMLEETVVFIPLWEHTETLDELTQKRDTLGVPQEQLWIEAGYTPEQITAMKQMPEYRVAFEQKLWTGAAAAQGKISLELYLKRVGLPETEIQAILEANNASNTEPTVTP